MLASEFGVWERAYLLSLYDRLVESDTDGICVWTGFRNCSWHCCKPSLARMKMQKSNLSSMTRYVDL
jgi:hypothetical protein